MDKMATMPPPSMFPKVPQWPSCPKLSKRCFLGRHNRQKKAASRGTRPSWATWTPETHCWFFTRRCRPRAPGRPAGSSTSGTPAAPARLPPPRAGTPPRAPTSTSAIHCRTGRADARRVKTHHQGRAFPATGPRSHCRCPGRSHVHAGTGPRHLPPPL